MGAGDDQARASWVSGMTECVRTPESAFGMRDWITTAGGGTQHRCPALTALRGKSRNYGRAH